MTAISDRIASARSFLFVPGDRPDRFDKAAASGAEVVILDLEDAVAETDKDHARACADAWPQQGNAGVVRINPADTLWFEADRAMVLDRGCPLMLPKADNTAPLAELGQQTAGRCPLIPLIETAAGIEHAADVCATAGAVRVALGNADLAAELGIAPNEHEALTYPRSKLVLASATAGLAPPIDGVTLALQDTTAVNEDVTHARRCGFTGKLWVASRSWCK